MGCSAGYRVFEQLRRPSPDLIEQFARFGTTDISDVMFRSGAMDRHVRAVDTAIKVAGPALTVRVAAGDNLMIYKALEVCRKGDVLVIETRRSTAAAVWGDRLSRKALDAGIAGMITDGCVRDRAGVSVIGLPVFANPSQVANGAYKHGPGEVNTPVSVGGAVVLPGDLVVGDADGVVVVHAADAGAILAKLRGEAAEPEECARLARAWGE